MNSPSMVPVAVFKVVPGSACYSNDRIHVYTVYTVNTPCKPNYH